MPFLCRAAPTGYLPAADDYEDDLAGYNADQTDTRSDDLAGYGDDNLSGYENGSDGQAEGKGQAQYGDDQKQYGDDQEQYEDDQYQYEESSGADPKNNEDNLSIEEALAEASASDAPVVGSASNVDPSIAAPDTGRTADAEYGAPEEGSGDGGTGYSVPQEAGAKDVGGDYSAPPEYKDQSRIADDSYGAPGAAEADYSAPRTADDEYGAPGQYADSQNDFPFAIVEGRQGSEAVTGNLETKVCPGGSLDVCVSVCPGITARVYVACVQGCADRCPEL